MTPIQIAQVCHEANTAYCAVVGDPALPHWDALEESYRQSSVNGVEAALAGSAPAALHESWMAERLSQGWVYGPSLDRVAKIHPNLISYDKLPSAQRVKDAIFLSIVRACQ